MKKNKQNNGIILYDGFCNLCSWSVQFIVRRDKNHYFKYVALQSGNVKRSLQAFNIPANFDKSLILIEGDSIWFKSDAALRIAKRLRGLWPLFYVFIIIPKPVRDSVYMFIAKNRFKWFGKRDNCYTLTGNSNNQNTNSN